MPAFVRSLTDEQEQQIVELYRDPNQSLSELKNVYGLSDSLLYNVLKRHGVPTRKKYHTGRPPRNGTAPEIAAPQRTIVTVDKTDTVQRVDRTPDSQTGPTWEVRFVGVVRVHGHSIDQALAEARKLAPMRSVIYAARDDA